MLNAELIPDLAALATLIVLLEVFRRRHPEDRVRLWLWGMLWILLECVARLFYIRDGAFHVITHVMALDAYIIAGTIFVYSSRLNDGVPLPQKLLMYTLNNLPMLVVETLYGADLRTNLVPYYACAAFALLTCAVITALYRRPFGTGRGTYIFFRLFNWLPVTYFVSMHQLRAAVYWLLATLFLAAGIGMHQTLERRSAGKLAIVAGFTLWAGCFVLHPFVTDSQYWAPIASRFWDLQKFIIMVGMLMVLLDEQIARNHALALHDDLTGLPNRRLLEDRLSQSMARSERNGTSTAVLLLDLNSFKNVNDTLGHAAGDIVLKQFTDRLKTVVRSADTLARYGGDEFVIVVSDLARGSSPSGLSSAIQQASRGEFHLQGHTFYLEAAIGAAVYPEDASKADDLLRLADDRMYNNKTSARAAFHLAEKFPSLAG